MHLKRWVFIMMTWYLNEIIGSFPNLVKDHLSLVGLFFFLIGLLHKWVERNGKSLHPQGVIINVEPNLSFMFEVLSTKG